MSSNNISTNNSFCYPPNPVPPTQSSNPHAEENGRDYRSLQPGYHAPPAPPPQYAGSFNAMAQQASAVNTLYMANPPSQMLPPSPHAEQYLPHTLYAQSPHHENPFTSWDEDPSLTTTSYGFPSSYSVSQQPFGSFSPPLSPSMDTAIQMADEVLQGAKAMTNSLTKKYGPSNLPGPSGYPAETPLQIATYDLSQSFATSSQDRQGTTVVPQRQHAAKRPASSEDTPPLRPSSPSHHSDETGIEEMILQTGRGAYPGRALTLFGAVLQKQEDALDVEWVENHPDDLSLIQNTVKQYKRDTEFFCIIGIALKFAEIDGQKNNVKQLATLLSPGFDVDKNRQRTLDMVSRSIDYAHHHNTTVALALAVYVNDVDGIKKVLNKYSKTSGRKKVLNAFPILYKFVVQKQLKAVYEALCQDGPFAAIAGEKTPRDPQSLKSASWPDTRTGSGFKS